jgi:hypothetical protein
MRLKSRRQQHPRPALNNQWPGRHKTTCNNCSATAQAFSQPGGKLSTTPILGQPAHPSTRPSIHQSTNPPTLPDSREDSVSARRPELLAGLSFMRGMTNAATISSSKTDTRARAEPRSWKYNQTINQSMKHGNTNVKQARAPAKLTCSHTMGFPPMVPVSSGQKSAAGRPCGQTW